MRGWVATFWRLCFRVFLPLGSRNLQGYFKAGLLQAIYCRIMFQQHSNTPTLEKIESQLVIISVTGVTCGHATACRLRALPCVLPGDGTAAAAGLGRRGRRVRRVPASARASCSGRRRGARSAAAHRAHGRCAEGQPRAVGGCGRWDARRRQRRRWNLAGAGRGEPLGCHPLRAPRPPAAPGCALLLE